MTSRQTSAANVMGRLLGCVVLFSALLVMAGCGASSGISPVGLDGPVTGSMTGHLHGGQNPVSGATVSLYVMGLTGYGSGSASGTYLATTTTDINGNFTFGTYTCPPANSVDELMYVVATGGNSGGGTNSAIALMAVLGAPTASNGSIVSYDTCSTIAAAKPFVSINEVSTVAAMYALAQFYNPTVTASYPAGTFGTPATNFQGLINAVNVGASLVATASGQVNPTYSPQGASVTPVGGTSTHSNDTATPDADKIYLIADILAACVNSTSATPSACPSLFGAAVPPPAGSTTTLGSTFTYPTATNTMQAAYYLAINPTNATTAGVPNTANMTTLYGLSSSTPPFAYSEAQPTDWTVGVVYSSALYGSGTTGLVSAPNDLSVDVNGYVIYLTASSTAFNQALAALNPYGGVFAFGLSSFGVPLQGYTIDSSDYGYLSKSAAAGSRATYTLTGGTSNKYNDLIEDSNDSNLNFQPANLASDGTYLFATTATAGDSGSIFQVPGTGQAGSPFTSATTTTSFSAALNAGGSNLISGMTLASPIVADANKHVYVAAGNALYQTTYSTTLPSGATGATPVSISGTFVTPPALAVDSHNNVWITNATGGSPANGYLSFYNPTGGTVVQDSTPGDGGVDNPAGIAVDGRGNIWVANAGTGTGFSGQTVSEFALIGGTSSPYVPGTLTALSPANGFVHTYSQPGSIAVDLSGNVWVANTGTKTNNYNTFITAYSITSNVITLTATNTLTAGQSVTLSGFPTSTFLNGQVLTVLATGLTGSHFEANFTNANASATEAGVAALNGSTPTIGSITCILGAASPVVTPIAKGIGLGTQGSLP